MTDNDARRAADQFAQHRDTLGSLQERGYFDRPVDSSEAKTDWTEVSVTIAAQHGGTPDLPTREAGPD